jgi:hypothetical protein
MCSKYISLHLLFVSLDFDEYLKVQYSEFRALGVDGYYIDSYHY